MDPQTFASVFFRRVSAHELGKQTSVVLTPGMRIHLGNDWYFLAGLPIPLTNQRVGDIGMIFWFMKAW
jgi:hypothetical protein